eukprot:4928746-Karenia_brevis.AAC.1
MPATADREHRLLLIEARSDESDRAWRVRACEVNRTPLKKWSSNLAETRGRHFGGAPVSRRPGAALWVELRSAVDLGPPSGWSSSPPESWGRPLGGAPVSCRPGPPLGWSSGLPWTWGRPP